MKSVRPVWVVLLLCLLFICTACSDSNDRSWLQAPGWSRPLPVGRTYSDQPVSLTRDDDGNLYLFLIDQSDQGRYPRFVAFNSDGEQLWEMSLDFTLRFPSSPTIIFDGECLRTFWVSDNQLFAAGLSLNGEVIEVPTQTSGNRPAGSLDALLDPDRGLIVWFGGTEDQPGIYAFAPDEYLGEPFEISPLGINPQIEMQGSNGLYAAWRSTGVGYGGSAIYYSHIPDLDFTDVESWLVAYPPGEITSMLLGPWLGFDTSGIYVFWNLRHVTGLEAGRITTEFVRIGWDEPNPDPERRHEVVRVPYNFQLDYQPTTEATFRGGEWVSLLEGDFEVTERLGQLSVVNSDGGQFAMALEAKVEYKQHKEEYQIAVLYYLEGGPEGYQLLTFTATSSKNPYLQADEEGYFYLTWQESSEEAGNLVYLASTEPSIVQALSAFSSGDFFNLAFDSLFGMVSGVILVPFGLIWLLVPIALIGITSPLRKEDEPLLKPGTLIGMVMALGGYWFGKLLTLRFLGQVNYVPFSAWIPVISEPVGQVLHLLIPVLIFLVAFVFAWNVTYRKDNRSLFFFIIYYAVVDAVSSMMIYGVLFYGVAG